MLEPLAPPHPALAAQHIDRRLVRLVLMSLRAAAGRDRQQLHMDRLRAHGVGGNGGRVVEPLLADERLAGGDSAAVRQFLGHSALLRLSTYAPSQPSPMKGEEVPAAA